MPTHPHMASDDDGQQHDCAPVHLQWHFENIARDHRNKTLCQQSHIYYTGQERGLNFRLEICAIRATNDEKLEAKRLRQ
jgi:hypothetical protein